MTPVTLLGDTALQKGLVNEVCAQEVSAIKAPSGGEWAEDLLDGVTAYFLTSLPVLLGVFLGADFLHAGGSDPSDPPRDLLAACVHFDATHYMDIIINGYNYEPAKRSTVAFFPAYPMLARCVSQIGLSPQEAGLVTANLFLAVAFVLLARYVRARWPEASAWQRALVLALFGLWPLGLFWRMPYAESLFLAAMLLFLYGLAREWPLPVLALLAGITTATRPVGVAATCAFVWYLMGRPGMRPAAKAAWLVALGPIACWGLLLWMDYQWLEFDAPLAFAQTQENWTNMVPKDRSLPAKVRSLATLEPIWGAYFDEVRGKWLNDRMPGGPFFSLYFWNPILFVLAALLLLVGGWKRWLTGSELVLGIFLLAIPYMTRSFEMSMASHGRFAGVVVVNYLVLGRMFARAGPLMIGTVCAALAVGICILTSLYAAEYAVY